MWSDIRRQLDIFSIRVKATISVPRRSSFRSQRRYVFHVAPCHVYPQVAWSVDWGTIVDDKCEGARIFLSKQGPSSDCPAEKGDNDV
jgi:hypothetical protein